MDWRQGLVIGWKVSPGNFLWWLKHSRSWLAFGWQGCMHYQKSENSFKIFAFYCVLNIPQLKKRKETKAQDFTIRVLKNLRGKGAALGTPEGDALSQQWAPGGRTPSDSAAFSPPSVPSIGQGMTCISWVPQGKRRWWDRHLWNSQTSRKERMGWSRPLEWCHVTALEGELHGPARQLYVQNPGLLSFGLC